MIIRLVNPQIDYEKVLFIKENTVWQETIKKNLSLYIDRHSLRNIICLLLGNQYPNNIRSINNNYIISKLPSSLQKFEILNTPTGNYEINSIGIRLNLHDPQGHIEIKFRNDSEPHRWFILNFHVRVDRRQRSTNFFSYFNILKHLISSSLEETQQKISMLERLSYRGFQQLGFKVAYHSAYYYIHHMIYNFWLAKKIQQQHIKNKQDSFEHMIATLSFDLHWFKSGYDDDYYDDSTSIIGYDVSQAGELDNNLSFLDFTEYKCFFFTKSIEFTEAIDGYRIGYCTEIIETPLELHNMLFVGSNLRDLELSDAKFNFCDFTNADLRGAKINFDNLDQATMVTLARAKLSEDLSKQLDEQVSKFSHNIPNLLQRIKG